MDTLKARVAAEVRNLLSREFDPGHTTTGSRSRISEAAGTESCRMYTQMVSDLETKLKVHTPQGYRYFLVTVSEKE